MGAEKDIDLFIAKRKEIGVIQGMWTRFYSLATLGAMVPGDFTETQPAGVHLEMDLFEKSTMNYEFEVAFNAPMTAVVYRKMGRVNDKEEVGDRHYKAKA